MTWAELPHPNGVVAYRVEAGGRSVTYATDTEHGGEAIDDRLVRLAKGSDLLIHDAQYRPEEYRGECGPPRRGWGHSTWEEAACAANMAEVERLALFHHDPARTDAGVEALEAQARRVHPGSFAAREGQVVLL